VLITSQLNDEGIMHINTVYISELSTLDDSIHSETDNIVCKFTIETRSEAGDIDIDFECLYASMMQ
jgi:hypothetical protein